PPPPPRPTTPRPPPHAPSFPTRRSSDLISAGEPLNPEVIDAWKRATGLTIREGYGQTETVAIVGMFQCLPFKPGGALPGVDDFRSEEHTSELQSLTNLVCRLLLEKKQTHLTRKPFALRSSYTGRHTTMHNRVASHDGIRARTRRAEIMVHFDNRRPITQYRVRLHD